MDLDYSNEFLPNKVESFLKYQSKSTKDYNFDNQNQNSNFPKANLHFNSKNISDNSIKKARTI